MLFILFAFWTQDENSISFWLHRVFVRWDLLWRKHVHNDIRDGPLFFWRGGMKIFPRQTIFFLYCCLCKQFFSGCIFLQTIFFVRVSNQWSRLVIMMMIMMVIIIIIIIIIIMIIIIIIIIIINFLWCFFLFFLLQGSQVTVCTLFTKFSF